MKKITGKIPLENICTPTGTLSSNEFFLTSQNTIYGTSPKPFMKNQKENNYII